MKMLRKAKKETRYMSYFHMDAPMWNNLIANPLVKKDKDMAPLFIFGHMKDVVQRDPNNGLIYNCGENIGWLYALQVDVDNGCTIEEFERDFGKYAHQLYTTTGFGIKDGDRFRSVFPLKEPIHTDWLVPPVKQYLCNLFDMCDKTCFDRGHWQIVPCILKEGNPYRYIQRDGMRLSFSHMNFEKMSKEYADDFHWKRAIAEADRDPSENHTGALKHVQQIFDSTTEGSRDTTVYKEIMWLKDTVQCDYNEVISLRPPFGFDEEFRRKVDRIYHMR